MQVSARTRARLTRNASQVKHDLSFFSGATTLLLKWALSQAKALVMCVCV